MWTRLSCPDTDDKIDEWVKNLTETCVSRRHQKTRRWELVERNLNKVEDSTLGIIQSDSVKLWDFWRYTKILIQACVSAMMYVSAETNYKYTVRLCDVMNCYKGEKNGVCERNGEEKHPDARNDQKEIELPANEN